ncbi:integrase, catalytic region, zinc finger, CCHC-type containing protein [Tanacetum coccineum]
MGYSDIKKALITTPSSTAISTNFFSNNVIDVAYGLKRSTHEFKARLASYKLKGDALNWWKAFKQAKGGETYVATLSWKDFRDIFFLQYFSRSEQQKCEREYHMNRQRDGETSGEFMKRFLRLAGFVGKKAGPPGEHAKHFKWALYDWILDGIVNTKSTDVAQVANAARNIEILRERSSQNNKRNHDRDRIRPTAQGSNQKGYDGRSYDRQDVNSQKGYPDYASSPLCDTCGKLHSGKACHRVTGAFFTCGSTGYMARNCPKNGGNGGKGNGNDNQLAAKGRVFSSNKDQAANSSGSIWMHPSTRGSTLKFSSPAFDAAVQRVVDALLPGLTTRLTNEIRQNGAGGSGNQPPTIHTWLERFGKQKPRSFSSATTPVDANETNGKENGVNILKSIDEGPFQMGTFQETLAEGNEGALHLGPERPRVYSDLSPEDKERYNADIRATNILLQGLPKDIYTLINHYTDAKDIWDNVKMLLEGSELTKEDRESQLYDDFEHFRQNKGETIHDYYVRFAKLINDMRNIKMTMSRMQLNSKFVNNMLPEWGRFVTAVKLNRGLRDSNYDQLYAYLKQHEAHANENKMMLDRFTQHTVDPLALMSNVSHQQYYSQSSTTPPSTYVPPHFADNTQLDSGISPTDNLIENLTNTLALLTQSYKTYLPQTNNQLRTSSNTSVI